MTKFWNFIDANNEGEDVELRIDGEIVSDDDVWLYEWFGITTTTPNQFREELKAYAGRNITVWIDSWGGEVAAAAGIYNALKEHKGNVTVKIDGKAVSAASIIAMAGDVVKISPAGIIMIHNPVSAVAGEAKDMRHWADVLDEVKNSLITVYQLKTGRQRSKISELMDNETWMSAKTAKAEGFVDEILYMGLNSAVTNHMPSMASIRNSAEESIKRFFEFAKQKKLLKKPEEPRQETRQVPVDLYTKLYQNIERRGNLI